MNFFYYYSYDLALLKVTDIENQKMLFIRQGDNHKIIEWPLVCSYECFIQYKIVLFFFFKKAKAA